MSINNQAEDGTLISALESASESINQEVLCHMDFELVGKYLNGEHKVEYPKLKTLWLKVQVLKGKSQRITFKHVSRADRGIEEVDQLANESLNRVTNRL